MLEANHIAVGYEGRLQTRKTDLVFAPGRVYAVIGKNGCGKSGLLKCLAGVQKSKTGTVLLDGSDVSMMPAGERMPKIGYLPTEPKASGLTVEYTVNGLFPLYTYSRPRLSEDVRNQIHKTLGEWKLSGLAGIPLTRLSRGECQRVHLAALVRQDPQILILDEPATGLDPEFKSLFLNQLVRWKQDGKTVIFATQDLNMALHHADKLVIVDAGKEVTVAPPEKMRVIGALDPVFHTHL